MASRAARAARDVSRPASGRGRRLTAAGGAALAAALLLAASARPAPAQAQRAPQEIADPGSATTLLHPGWNMVAWLGPEVAAADLFDAVPAAGRVVAWDASSQGYTTWERGGVPGEGRGWLTAGMGVWLELRGAVPYEWTRPAAADGVLLSLHSGWNVVGWSGEDGTPVEAALARFGDTLVQASRWDAGSRRYLHYRPGAPAGAGTLAALDRGDALWVMLTEDARWWQSGAAGVDFQFPEGLPDATRARIRADTASAVAFFAERYGVGPPELEVVFRPELITVTGESIAAASRGRIIINTTFVSAVDAGVIAHEYFHTLQHELGRRSLGLATDPWWMREGAATYAAHRYVRVAVDGVAAEAPHPGPSGLTYDLVRLNRLGAPALAEVERPVPFYRDAPITYSLGLLAVDWLVDHSSEEAVVDYYRRLADEDSWQRAFEAAFGIAVEDFQERFAAYRAVVFPPLPHVTDDSLDPVVVVVGDASPEQEAAARSRFADLQAFGERFGGGRAHLTVYIGDADSLEPVFRRFYVTTTPSRACSSGEGGFLILEPDCPEREPLAVIVPYLRALRGQLAPGSAVPQIAGDHERLGPYWLHLAIEGHIQDAYRVETGSADEAALRERRIVMARRTAAPLAALGTVEDAEAHGNEPSLGLSVLAGERLAGHAGEAALLDYYRRLPDSASWREAFESAFGLAPGDFHAAFEAARAATAPPFVLHRVRGVLLDPDGRPSAGAWIAAEQGRHGWEDLTHTAEDGSFELLVRDGRHSLFTLLSSTGCDVPSVYDLYRAGEIVVDGADVSGVEMRLPEGSSCAGAGVQSQ